MNDALVSDGVRSRAREATGTIRAVIKRQIEDGTLPPGARLAAERDLARQFSASRAVVRSAVMALVAEGRVTRHVGRGSFVAGTIPGAFDLLFPDIAPAEMMEFRCQLDPALIDMILLNAGNADIAAIVACVEEGEGAADRVAWNANDDRFHRLMAAATHNRLVIALYDAFSAARLAAAWNRLKQQTVNPFLWRDFQTQHRRIADALVRGDRDEAVRATREHIMQARAIMLGYAPMGTP